MYGLDRYCPLAISLTEVDDDRFIKTEMEQYPSRAEHWHLLSGYFKTKR